MAKLTSEEREILINAMVEADAIEEDDREVYEGLKDDKLLAFADSVLNSEADDDDDDSDDDDDDDDYDDADEDVVGNADDDEDSDDDEDLEDEDDDDEDLTTNAHVCNKCAGKKGKGKKPAMEDEEDEMTGNMTTEEWLATAPPEIAEVVTNTLKYAQEEKAKLIDRITANLQGDHKKSMVRKLATNSLDQLKDIESLIPKAPTANTAPVIPGVGRASFRGAATANGVTQNSKKVSQPLIPPTINYADLQREFSAESN